MNIASIITYSMSIGVFLLSVVLSFTNPSVLIDYKSVIIVVGGTITSTMVSFKPQKVIQLLKVYFRRLFGKTHINFDHIMEDIVKLSKARRKGMKEFDKVSQECRHPFFTEGVEILFWAESDVSDDELKETLDMRADSILEEYLSDSKMFRTIGKFPPAFGLMGTTIGMIALLQSLGGDNITETIGGSMAVALITTLYGLAISNILILPVAEHLERASLEQDVVRRIIVEALIQIHKGMPTQYVCERAASFLIPSQRNRLSASSNKADSGTRKRAA